MQRSPVKQKFKDGITSIPLSSYIKEDDSSMCFSEFGSDIFEKKLLLMEKMGEMEEIKENI